MRGNYSLCNAKSTTCIWQRCAYRGMDPKMSECVSITGRDGTLSIHTYICTCTLYMYIYMYIVSG